MKPRVQRAICWGACLASVLSGCAVTPQYFYSSRDKLSDSQVCRTWLDGVRNNASTSYLYDVSVEAQRRGHTFQSCGEKIASENKTAAVVGVTAALIGVLAIAARKGGGGGGAVSTPVQQQDIEWDWDEFYSEQRQLVWACRGVQTGQFAEAWHCDGKLRSDWRWPSKEALR